MSCVAVLVHPSRSEASAIARSVVHHLQAEGHEVRLPIKDAANIGRPELGVADVDMAMGTDLAVSIGGDGTMLRTVELVGPHEIPVAGIHVGHLGYLTEIEPADAHTAIDLALSGRATVVARMMLNAAVERADGTLEPGWLALNELVVEKDAHGHTARLGVEFDGCPLWTYAADALIVSTPTGSTAYSLSARGAVVSPGHRCLQLTPVAPHMLFDRPLVVDPSTEIRIEVLGDREVSLVLDGRTTARLTRGDVVVATEAPVAAHLVSFGRRRFHDVLKAKFGLQDR
jgi:NAD+ kinase